MITGLLKSVVIKIFPWLSYRGVVNGQIKMYRRLINKGVSEQDALNELLNSRRKALNITNRVITNTEDLGADEYYRDLTLVPNKTLAQTIKAIVEWEYLHNAKSYELRTRNRIPSEQVEKFKNEMSRYITMKIASLEN